MSEFSKIMEEYRISLATGIIGGGLGAKAIYSATEGSYVQAIIEAAVAVPMIVTTYIAPARTILRRQRLTAAAAGAAVQITDKAAELQPAAHSSIENEPLTARSSLTDYAGQLITQEALDGIAAVSAAAEQFIAGPEMTA